MKIKTITCHEVYNSGASLQEYALLRFLQSHGYDAETIHYKPSYLSNHFKLWNVSNPKFNLPLVKQLYLLAKLPGRLSALRKKKNFDAFHQKYIRTGNRKYTSNAELKSDIPKADAYICGSDQIWNSFFENGKDPAFYLDFVPDGKLKMSYAASFAQERIEESIEPFVREKVSSIQHVSVRETSALDILSRLGIHEAQQVLDPVFLLSAEDWRNTFVKKIPDRYIFVYDFDNNPEIEAAAQKIAQQHDCKIFTVNRNVKYADRNFWDAGPDVFVSLVDGAEMVLSNSFHATAFSIIFQKQMRIFNRNEKINTRMRDLLTLFGLGNMMVAKVTDLNDEKIDYGQLRPELQKHLTRSQNFLLNALKNG